MMTSWDERMAPNSLFDDINLWHTRICLPHPPGLAKMIE